MFSEKDLSVWLAEIAICLFGLIGGWIKALLEAFYMVLSNERKNFFVLRIWSPLWDGTGLNAFPIPRHILLDIKATPIPQLANIDDRLAWISSPNGDFDPKDAYHIACSRMGNMDNGQFRGA